jgi:hypothetical protein
MLLTLNLIALILSIAWLIFKPDYEPAIAVVTLFSTLFAQYYSKKTKKSVVKQKQKSGDHSNNIQIGNYNKNSEG